MQWVVSVCSSVRMLPRYFLTNRLLTYDTRCYFNVRSKADISQLNLPHGKIYRTDFDCLPVSEYNHSSPGTKSQSNRSIGQWSIQKYVCHKSRKNRCNAAWPDFNQQHCQQQFSNNCWDSNIFQQYCPWRPITRSIWLMSAFDRTSK